MKRNTPLEEAEALSKWVPHIADEVIAKYEAEEDTRRDKQLLDVRGGGYFRYILDTEDEVDEKFLLEALDALEMRIEALEIRGRS